jgi:uncharacterized protein
MSSPTRAAAIKLTWQECQEMIDLLAEALRPRPIDVVVGISRSGLVPAVMLSHALGVRPFAVLDIARTESDDHNAAKRAPELRDIMNVGMLPGRRLLLVDDIVGAGATLAAARALLEPICQEVRAAVLVWNLANSAGDGRRQAPDHHACLVHGWVEFPWECKPAGEGHHA